MRVLLVAPNASARMGGEAILPLHWLRELRALGVDARLLTHVRCKEEIDASAFAGMPVHYIEDSGAEREIWKFRQKSKGIAWRLGGFSLQLTSMIRLGKEARKIADRDGIDLIHQVIPVSPRLPSPVTHPRIPVVIGPLNGNMTFPDGFATSYGDASEEAEGLARKLSAPMHSVFGGKPKAARVLVSNERTAAGLPDGVDASRVVEFVENGVDLSLWQDERPMADGPARFIFVGRLVNWKALDILLEAFAQLGGDETLTICGDGVERAAWQKLAGELGLGGRVRFLGAIPQADVVREMAEAHCLALPSVYECGGAVVLEAMALRRAVIASDWGGPADYVRPETGILVPPTSRDQFRDDLAEAMRSLGSDMERMRAMGEAGRQRVEEHFAWKMKGERMLALYGEVLAK
ncbi:glycosyltransferase family 4 protein [Parvularcula sp. ZS-1/3]|uniref:Glycosyltransferase family 4 protein n=1 Tax=Parvularcula mediterranea TaxID=2732508 RepID=A0A7Y3RK61_9PROT|nr:glycosyltransferase family 4 protein [Parvularcula mediterranea]NNU15526.1 glycosyltransferase family 4 protein [Parvularcula mediterranea]